MIKQLGVQFVQSPVFGIIVPLLAIVIVTKVMAATGPFLGVVVFVGGLYFFAYLICFLRSKEIQQAVLEGKIKPRNKFWKWIICCGAS